MELQRWGQIFKPHNNLWRAGLPALGREAALDADATFCLKERGVFYWGCCAAQRGQARSPQGRRHTISLRIHSTTDVRFGAQPSSSRACLPRTRLLEPRP